MAEGRFAGIGHVKKRRFLNEFALHGRIGLAASAAGVNRHSHYHWMATDSEYVAAFARAQEIAGDVLEDEAVRRAVEGVEEPVYRGGEQVGVVTRYSDTLLIFLLKGGKPAKFADRRDVNLSGSLALSADDLLAALDRRKQATEADDS